MQRDRWILWLPVAVIAGAAVWLAAPSDPPLWIGAALFLSGIGAATIALVFFPGPSGPVVSTARTALLALAALTSSFGLGACAAQLRASSVVTPAYVATEEPVGVEGWVVGIDASDRGPRLRLLVRDIEGVATPPRYVRIAVPAAGALTPGRAARCFALLSPPAGPMAPGAYDFARRAYFERLGASGFGLGRCRPAAFEPPASWFDRQRLRLEAARADLSASIQAAAPGRGGQLAAALIAGDRSAIDPETNDAFFNSGLGHILSVGGMHMSVVGGLVFAMLLWGLSLIPAIALRVPIKKIAAIGALAGVGAYLVISGINVPALRAFVMAAVAFGAILLDRPAISMRGLALAVVVVVLLFPESVLEPGFQMSFGATMALVALFEMMKRAPHEPALPSPGPLIGAMQWTTRGVGVVLLISLFAGLATDPFALYHFQRFSIYSLPANLLSEPILTFMVAPCAIAAALLAPFGLAEPPLQLMASGLELVAAIGDTFGSRPEAVRALSKPPDGAFLLWTLALLWACFWRGALRWGGLVFLALGIALYAAAPRPIAAFDGDLRTIFVRAEEGGEARWTLLAGRSRSTYVQERLGSMLGLSPARLERLAPPEGCAEAACVVNAGQAAPLIVVRSPEGFALACEAGALVISRAPAPPDFSTRCAPAALFTPEDRAERGGAFIYAGANGWRVERALSPTVLRAWTPTRSGDAELQE